MVYENPYHIEKHNSTLRESSQLPPPIDRVLASIFDLILHAPIFSLFSFIIVYRFNLLKVTISTTSEKMAVFVQLVWVFVVGTVILQAIYFKLFHKTPGMRLLKLELKSTSGEELSWSQCILRSTVWCLEIFLLGVPLLGIFSHPKRHALHDRVSESEIYSFKMWGALSPLPAEKSMVQFIMTIVIMLSLGWITALFSLSHKGIKDGSIALSEWREQGQLCSEVDDLSSYSNIDLSLISKRLDFALGLYLFEQIDSDCLRKEIDLALLKKIPGGLVWAGRAFLSTSHTAERKNYSQKACAEDSRWCHSLLSYENANLEDAKAFLNQNVIKSDIKQSIAVEETDSIAISAAQLILLNRLGAESETQILIEKLQNYGIRATGLVAEHLKFSFRSHPDQASLILSSLKSVMVEKDYLRLNAEICLRHLESGCSSKMNECIVMKNLLPSYKESLNDLVVSRAVYKSAICQNDLIENMEYWTLISDESLQKLIAISQQLNSEESKLKGLARLRNFIQDESQKVELRFDALQLLLSHSAYQEDWRLAPKLWSQFHWTDASYLSVSEWLLSEAKKKNQTDFIADVEETYLNIPGLKLAWNLIGNGREKRIPASVKGK